LYVIEFREELQTGIEDGEPSVLVPVMNWLLERKDQLKSRAYLSKYLVKLEVPEDLNMDEDVSAAFEKVKANHKIQ
jgi:intraflagellar transport protein 81